MVEEHKEHLNKLKQRFSDSIVLEKELNEKREHITKLNATIAEMKERLDTVTEQLRVLTDKSSQQEATLQNELTALRKHSKDVQEQLEYVQQHCQKHHTPLESQLSERQLRVTELEKLLVTTVNTVNNK